MQIIAGVLVDYTIYVCPNLILRHSVGPLGSCYNGVPDLAAQIKGTLDTRVNKVLMVHLMMNY